MVIMQIFWNKNYTRSALHIPIIRFSSAPDNNKHARKEAMNCVICE